MQTLGLPGFADVQAAYALLDGTVNETPCIRSAKLSTLTGAGVSLKLENLQHTASFKVRGAGVKLRRLSAAERIAGVVAASAGNHAQGVAYHGALLGIATTIVMPQSTPYTKVRRTESLGARVLLHGSTLAAAALEAERLQRDEGLTMIHPYDDPDIVAGQGTVALEMLKDGAAYDAVVVPVGGGGLIAGMATVIKHLSPRTQVIGVQIARTDTPTLAEGIAVKQIGDLNRAVVERNVDDILTVGEPPLERAVHLLLDEEKIVAEGAGAAALAALLTYPERFLGRRTGIVVSGGNIDSGLLASVILRARLQEGRVARIRVEIVDSPGALAQISNLLAQHHANVVDVSHHRAFSSVPAKCAELEFTIEMRNPRDVTAIMQDLRDATFEAVLLTGGDSHVQ